MKIEFENKIVIFFTITVKVYLKVLEKLKKKNWRSKATMIYILEREREREFQFQNPKQTKEIVLENDPAFIVTT